MSSPSSPLSRVFRTRSTRVQAVQFDGHNLALLNAELAQAGLGPVPGLLEVGCWLVIARGDFQVLPDKVFGQIYEPVPLAPVLPTCFECEHYAMTGGGSGLCQVYDEPIDSECHAAADCPSFERAP